MTLRETRERVEALVRAHNRDLQVTGVFPRSGAPQVEVLLVGVRPADAAVRLLLNVDREAPESFASALERAFLREHHLPPFRES